jgi:hypothetical protein
MSILVPPKWSTRLVTQNLLVSAAAALEPDRYVSAENVEDLAAVISLACLYDRLILVGPQHLLDFDHPLLSWLRSDVVITHEPDDGDWKRAVATAEDYVSAVFGGQFANAGEIFGEIYRMSRRFGIDRGTLSPDGPRDVEVGRSLLSEMKETDDLRKIVARGYDWIVAAYVLRTFLYVGFSERMDVPLATDSARQPLLEHLADKSQDRIREAILAFVTEGLRSDRTVRWPLRRLASPFAAIVFSESRDRRAVVDRLRTIREEQLDLRLRLRPLEEKLHTTTGNEKDEAQARVAAALEQLAHTYSVKSSEDLRIRRFLRAFKPGAALAALNPVDAADMMAKGLLDREAEGTLIELHNLKRNLPSTADQDTDIRRLFDL